MWSLAFFLLYKLLLIICNDCEVEEGNIASLLPVATALSVEINKPDPETTTTISNMPVNIFGFFLGFTIKIIPNAIIDNVTSDTYTG